MDKFPALVYRCPGPHQRPGGTFGHKAVASKEEESAALADGWFLTVPEAITGETQATRPDTTQVVRESPPTRAELEQKATELGLKFDKTPSNDALNKAIAGALKA